MTRYTKKDTFSIKIADENFALRKFSYLPISKKDKGEIMGEDAIVNKAIDKLSALEDIEEELGIDLITLFKALEKGVYVKSDGLGITFVEQVSMDNVTEERCFYYCDENTIDLGGLIRPSYTELYFKDYGKTWALTKEELK